MSESDSTPQAPALLDEDKATTLEELFDRDPLGWTDSDVDKIVAQLRLQRHKFNSSELAKQVEGKPRGKATALPKAKAAPAKPAEQLGLDDLGLLD